MIYTRLSEGFTCVVYIRLLYLAALFTEHLGWSLDLI